jgi:D-amino-acid dehydrogenase
MEIAVIGAGIAGVTTAWELAQDGHQVTVFDRRLAIAEEGSFANGGIVGPASLIPWVAPGMKGGTRRALLKASPLPRELQSARPLTMGERAWRWKRALLGSGTETRRMHALRELARYSHERLHTLAADLELDFERTMGVLLIVRSKKELEQLRPGLQLLTELGIAHQELDAAQARTIEPALHEGTPFHAAIHLPHDEAGNCRQFAQMLRDTAQARGVEFVFGADVQGLVPSVGANVTGLPARLLANMQVQIRGEAQPRRFDAVVLCSGAGTAQLLKPLKPLLKPHGIKLPLVTTHGYSISAQVREPLNAPRSAVLDTRHKVAITRMGMQRIRASGGAIQLGGKPDAQRDDIVQNLYTVLRDWFPAAPLLSGNVQTWKGMQVMLPDNAPLIGPAPVPGLWLNCAHGALGWTLACGAARVLADQMQGKYAGIAPSVLAELGLERLAR